MIRSGETLENAVTGEALTFHTTSSETDGEFVRFETVLQPGGFVAAAHVHPRQDETFEVLEGNLGLRRGRERLELGAGGVAAVAAGTPHRFWNAGDDEARFLCTIAPALQFESLIETMFELAGSGKTNRKGLPNPLQLAVIAQAHFETVRLPFPPAPLQRAALAVGASLGRLVGYERYASVDPVQREHDWRVAPRPALPSGAGS